MLNFALFFKQIIDLYQKIKYQQNIIIIIINQQPQPASYINKTMQQQKLKKQQNQMSEQQQSEQSQYSSEDEDGKLLTNKVQQKLLTFVAKLKNKDPEIYNIKKSIFEQDDFDKNQNQDNDKDKKDKNKKFTYKDMVNKGDKGASDDQHSQDEKKDIGLDQIKSNFKKKLAHQANGSNQQENEDLFKIKRRIQLPKKSQKQKLKQFVSTFDKQSSKLLTNLWKNDQKLDKTDLFLRNYILNQKWKTSKFKNQQFSLQQQKMVDQQDQQRSIQMDQYQAQYNFRYQQPGSDKIMQYPRQIPESMRLKPESRKQKRKKLLQRKKQDEQQIRKQAQIKKKEKKQEILKKLHQQQDKNNNIQQEESSDFQHDWFFCDDCTKPLEQNQEYFICNQCGEYMLCEECHQLIIHKHIMQRAVIPKGAGPPKSQKAQKALKKLKNCKTCRKKIPHYLSYYQYNQKSTHINHIMCEKCYDQSGLQIKKKFKLVQPASTTNFEQILDKNPQKIKQLTTQKDIEELVDEYLKYDFQDVIGGGLKTKFKYMNVKPQGYGLSDQQILYGDDKELNKYVSIKKLGPYQQQDIKLRNNFYKRKIKSIIKSAHDNKKILNKLNGNGKALRSIKKMQTRAEILRKRRQSRNQKLKIINISNPQDQKKFLIPNSRLESYGLTTQSRQNTQTNQKYGKKKKFQ